MYRINDIFYSLQGEGHNTGRAAVFIRFAGCNLRCSFCDTEFDEYREMNSEAILQAIAPYPARFAVLTGGEPTLQVDETFIDMLHKHGYEVAMESNGTRPAPKNLDWLTVSPKSFSGERRVERGEWREESEKRREESGERRVERGEWREEREERMPDEIKIIFEEGTDPESILLSINHHLTPSTHNLSSDTRHPTPILYLQPCDTGNVQKNARITEACIRYIEEHPQWRLSLQTHKLIGFK